MLLFDWLWSPAAEGHGLGRDVAIKVMAAHERLGQSRDRCQREVRAVAAVNHPAVAHVHEAGEATWPVEPGDARAWVDVALR